MKDHHKALLEDVDAKIAEQEAVQREAQDQAVKLREFRAQLEAFAAGQAIPSVKLLTYSGDEKSDLKPAWSMPKEKAAAKKASGGEPKSRCLVSGCKTPASARGLCPRHLSGFYYHRKKNRGMTPFLYADTKA